MVTRRYFIDTVRRAGNSNLMQPTTEEIQCGSRRLRTTTGSPHGPMTANILHSDPSATEAASTSCRRKVERAENRGFRLRPQWSPDGSKSSFFGPLRAASALSTELYVVDLDGTLPVRCFFQLLGSFQSFQASWVPRRPKGFCLRPSDRRIEPDLWTVSLDGRGRDQILDRAHRRTA